MESFQELNKNGDFQPATCSKEDRTEQQGGSSLRKRYLPIDNSQFLETKFSREAEKIIKLRVTADAVNWELKQRVKDLEGIRERQQQNLIQLQMQYETLDMKLQNELRLREDIINKVATTRSICQVLETHTAAAIGTLAQCEKDRQILCDAYEKAAQGIHDVHEKTNQFQQRHQIIMQALQDKYNAEVRLKNECDKKWTKVVEQNEKMIEQLREQIVVQHNFNDLLKLQKEDALNLIQKTARENKEFKDNLNQNTEALDLLKSEYAVSKNKYIQQIVDLEAAMKEKDVISAARENEFENTKMMLIKKNKLNEELEAAHNETKQNLEQTMTQLRSIEASWKKQIQETSELETQMELAVGTKTEEVELLREALKESQNKLSLLQQCNDSLTEQSEAYRMEVDIGQNKYNEDISSLNAKVTFLTEKLNEKTETVLLLEKDKNTAGENALSMSDTIASLMSQLKSSTDLRGKLQKSFDQAQNKMLIFQELQSEKDKQKQQEIQLLEEKMSSMKSLLNTKIEHCMKIQNENELLQKELTIKASSKLESDVSKMKVRDSPVANNSPLIGSTTKDEKKREKFKQNVNNASTKRKAENTLWKMPINPKEVNSDPTSQGKKLFEIDPFMSDSSYDGYVYDVELVKRQFRDTLQPEQHNSTSLASRALEPVKNSKKKRKYSLFDRKLNES